MNPRALPMTVVISARPVNHRVGLSLENLILKIKSHVNDRRSLWGKLLSMIRLRLNVTIDIEWNHTSSKPSWFLQETGLLGMRRTIPHLQIGVGGGGKMGMCAPLAKRWSGNDPIIFIVFHAFINVGCPPSKKEKRKSNDLFVSLC